MPFAPVRRRPYAVVVGGVLGLHVLLLLGLLRLGTWSDRSGPVAAQLPVLLRLLPLPLPLPLPSGMTPAHRTTAISPAEQRTAADRSARLLPRPSLAGETQAITLPAAAASAAFADTATAATSTAGAASTPASAPLDLRLRRGVAGLSAPRNPALDDPRTRNAPATLASRLTAAVGGDGVWVEERMDSGDNTRVRLHRGNECIEVYKAREAQLNPFNQTVSAVPAQKSGAKPC